MEKYIHPAVNVYCWVSIMFLKHVSLQFLSQVICYLCSCVSYTECFSINHSQFNPLSVVNVYNEADAAVSLTLLLNVWKPPRKQKESSMMMSQQNFRNMFTVRKNILIFSHWRCLILVLKNIKVPPEFLYRSLQKTLKANFHVSLYVLMSQHKYGKDNLQMK